MAKARVPRDPVAVRGTLEGGVHRRRGADEDVGDRDLVLDVGRESARPVRGVDQRVAGRGVERRSDRLGHQGVKGPSGEHENVSAGLSGRGRRGGGRGAGRRGGGGRAATACNGYAGAGYCEQSDNRRSFLCRKKDHSRNIATASCATQGTETSTGPTGSRFVTELPVVTRPVRPVAGERGLTVEPRLVL